MYPPPPEAFNQRPDPPPPPPEAFNQRPDPPVEPPKAFNPNNQPYRREPEPLKPAPAPASPMRSPVAAFQTQSRGPVPWSTGLLDCTDDCGNCCMTCFCPCITFGRIAEIVDQGSTSCGASGALYGLLEYFTCCRWLYSCMYRSKLRAQYSLDESPCSDCLVHCCCEYCALCQEYRELKSRGFDMTIGWHGNMKWQAPGATFQPPIQGSMTR